METIVSSENISRIIVTLLNDTRLERFDMARFGDMSKSIKTEDSVYFGEFAKNPLITTTGMLNSVYDRVTKNNKDKTPVLESDIEFVDFVYRHIRNIEPHYETMTVNGEEVLVFREIRKA
jgi:hypothetical protein